MTIIESALQLANDADAHYAQVIRDLYGVKANRWSITVGQSRHPSVRSALQFKIDADQAFQTAFRTAIDHQLAQPKGGK